MCQRVIIVEALSTGFNLVQDCFDRGLEPVILEVCVQEEDAAVLLEAERAVKYRRLDSSVQILREKEDYQETLEMVRALAPTIVMPGAEDGVILATRLADDLGLLGNPASLLDRMTNKYHMHRALDAAGVRSIHGQIIRSAEEALAFYDKLDTEKVVIKPPHGAASVGVRFCSSREELLRNVNEQLDTVGCLGDRATELILQERIIGTEYIVNTITLEGQHRVTSIWQYEKRSLENGSNVYVGEKAVTEVDPETYALTAYAFRVLDAIGIRHGPVHGEYMMDENGPVLIEINCRCMGSSYPRDYGDAVFGHHETDLALDSYVNPERVKQVLDKPYGVRKYAMLKDIIVPCDMPIASTPLIGLVPYLRSYHSCTLNTSAEFDRLNRTVDLETEAGNLYLYHEDYAVLQAEYDLLCCLESRYFGLLYQDHFDTSLGSLPYLEAEMASLDSYTITLRRLKDYPREDVYRYLKEIHGALKPGGEIIIPVEVYEDFPYGISGFIMVLRIMDMEIRLPGRYDRLVAVKR